METAKQLIEKTKMFKSGEIIGVGVSGGADSMALLHFLAQNAEDYDIEVVAIHVDHGIRENSFEDADFVKQKAKEMGVRFYKFSFSNFNQKGRCGQNCACSSHKRPSRDNTHAYF